MASKQRERLIDVPQGAEGGVDGGMLKDGAGLKHPIELCGSETPGIQRQLLDAVQALDWRSGRVLFRHASRLQTWQWRVATGRADAWRGDEPPRLRVRRLRSPAPGRQAGADDHTSRRGRDRLRRLPRGVQDREFEWPRLRLRRPTGPM